MEFESHVLILRNNRLFKGIDEETLQRIAAIMVRRRFVAGTTLFYQGDPGESFYGIEAGRIRISSSSPEGRDIHFRELGAGDTFGEIALLDSGPRTATAEAVQDSTAFAISRASFRELVLRDAELGLRLLERLCERVRWTSELVEDLSFLGIEAQIAKRLRLLIENFGADTPQGRTLSIRQGDLAAFLGLSRQAINTHLQEWRAEGWLDISRGQLLVRDYQRLINRCA